MKIINLDLLVGLRKKHQITQAELARKVGVTRFAINSIESGRMNPSLPLAAKIADVLECKIDDLIFFSHDVDSKSTVGGNNVNCSS